MYLAVSMLTLSVYHAMTCELLHTWQLPALKYCPARDWAWSCYCAALLLPYGDVWQGCRPGKAKGSGYGFLVVQTGTCLDVIVPVQRTCLAMMLSTICTLCSMQEDASWPLSPDACAVAKIWDVDGLWGGCSLRCAFSAGEPASRLF